MNLIHVIPITRGFGAETVSYFSAANIPIGSVVSVPFRRKTIPAVVVGSEGAEEAKSRVRRGGFALKKIATQKVTPLLSSAFITAVRETADYAAAPLSSAFASIIPHDLFDVAKTRTGRAKQHEAAPLPPTPLDNILGERLILSQPTESRYDTYKSLVREEFARNASVFVVVPTLVDALRLSRECSRGIGQHVFVLHSSLSKKERDVRISRVLEASHPVMIVGTAGYLATARNDIRTIILEKETSHAYRTPSRPFLDMRVLAERYAYALRARLIVADLPLRIETVVRHHGGEFDELTSLGGRAARETEYIVVDVREREKKDPTVSRKKIFRALHQQMERQMADVLQKNKSVVLFAARRGISGSTVCDDCGSLLSCTHCGASVVLHRTPSGNVFLCHTCGLLRKAATLCDTCGGWRLSPLGIGVERVEDEIRKQFPGIPIVRIDKDSTKTHREAEKARDRFYRQPGSILLGTEMMLSYLDVLLRDEPSVVGVCGIVSLDSLLLLPLWSVSERLLGILHTLAEATDGSVVIQTRRPDYPLFDHLLRGTLLDAYREEIKERETLGYPPFHTLITLAVSGSAHSVQEVFAMLREHFKDDQFFAYAAPTVLSANRYRAVGLLKVPRGRWPDSALLARIRALPPSVEVAVNPENIL